MNLYLLEYAINSLLRQRRKNIFILTIFTLLISFVASAMFIATSIKKELLSSVEAMPSMIVQNIKGGKPYDVNSAYVDRFLEIHGVSSVIPRVWGYYYFLNAGVNFTVIGVDEFETSYKNSLDKATENSTLFAKENSMLIGSGVAKVLEENYYQDYFNFITPQGGFKKVEISGVISKDLELFFNDTIILTKKSAKEIFDIDDSQVTDIVVEVANPEEIPTVRQKIIEILPSARVITQEDLLISYRNIFDYKSGFFLGLFSITLFTFFMIIYDKTTSVTSEEKKEIGILKAVGWSIEDVVKEKFYEGALLSFFSFVLGVFLATLFVYGMKAPLLSEIFTGYSKLKTSFSLEYFFDFQTISLIFFVTVPIYIGATILPSWKIATIDSDEVMR